MDDAVYKVKDALVFFVCMIVIYGLALALFMIVFSFLPKVLMYVFGSIVGMIMGGATVWYWIRTVKDE